METWTSDYNDYNDLLEGYHCHILEGYRKGSRGHYNGGISVYIKSELSKKCKRIFKHSKLAIYIILLQGEVLLSESNILLCCVYLPPEGSPFYTDGATGVALLENEVTEILITMDRKPMLILIGVHYQIIVWMIQ